jgi:hypothetical protein
MENASLEKCFFRKREIERGKERGRKREWKKGGKERRDRERGRMVY